MLSGSNAGISPRVLFVASTRSQGGIERHSVALAAALLARGVSIQYACPPGSFLETACRERAIPTPSFTVRNSGDLRAALFLSRAICTHRIDIVHAHSRRDSVVAVLAVALARGRGHQVRLVLHAHLVRPLGEPARLSGRFFRWGADAVVAVSQAVADQLGADPGPPIHLITNGVDLAAFALPKSPESGMQRGDARQAWGIPFDAPTLGMVGRLDSKGQADLLDALPAVAARLPTLRVVLIGAEGSEGARARLTARAASAGMADRLLFLGTRADVPALLPGLDVLVHLPSDEAFGLALAEAMAAGLPTVATDIGGCREVVRDGVTGLLVPPGDTPALVAALLRPLDPTDGERLRAQMGRAGRKVVEQDYAQDVQIDRLLTLYRALCEWLN